MPLDTARGAKNLGKAGSAHRTRAPERRLNYASSETHIRIGRSPNRRWVLLEFAELPPI